VSAARPNASSNACVNAPWPHAFVLARDLVGAGGGQDRDEFEKAVAAEAGSRIAGECFRRVSTGMCTSAHTSPRRFGIPMTLKAKLRQEGLP